MTFRVVVQPEAEPVTLAEAKAHLRLEEEVDDVMVERLIKVARMHVEKVCARGLVLQTVEVVGPRFPVERMKLPGGHLADSPNAVVKYLDADGIEQTVDVGSYYASSAENADKGPGFLYRSGTWPTVSTRADAVRVRYQVGWATPADVPGPIKHAVLLALSQMYEHRTPEITGTIATELSFSFKALLYPFMFWGL